MSDEESAVREGYYPVGRGRFGLFLIAATLASVLVVWLLGHFLSGTRARDIGQLAAGLIWMSVWVKPLLASDHEIERRIDEEASDTSARGYRLRCIVFLILWTLFAALAAQSLLFPPAQPPAFDAESILQNLY